VKYLKNTSAKKLEQLNKAVHKAGFVVEAEVKQSISGHRPEPKSVDTGAFINSISTDTSKPLISTIASHVPYDVFLEYGTSKREPRHHFRNSKSRTESKVKDMIKKAI